ncbi:hypothetical protein CR513_57871, partial [Mucuna pruriens]
MGRAQKAKAGCLSTFLGVLLCAGNGSSPPVHPTEMEESENADSVKERVVVVDDDNGSTPGVVARLMGLDSLPNPKLVVKGGRNTPDSVPRSRSVNFVDYLLEFDQTRVNHRRVKTSASFREVPGLLRQKGDGDELFMLCMDGNNFKDQEVTIKQRKRQGSVKKERNQGKSKKISKLRNEPRRVPSSKHGFKGRNRNRNRDCHAKDLSSFSSVSSVSSVSSNCSSCCSNDAYYGASSRSRLNSSFPDRHKKGFVEPKLNKSMRNQQSLFKVESLENHSPVSVLDTSDYHFLSGPDFLDGTSTMTSKSKWSLGDGVEESASSNKGYAFIDVNKEAEYYLELMLKLRTLTEQDITESDCTSKRIRESENFGDICLMFEHKIFDLLLYEVVNEVLELCS